jgi:hypothetical protein
MNRLFSRPFPRQWMALLFLLLAALSLPACASHETLVRVELVDLDSGQTLPAAWHRGQDWVAGEPGRRYAVVIENLTNERVLAVLSVDGVNAVTGQTAGTSQPGYVLMPWQRVEIRGWRKSMEESAAFYFTDLPDSYAARTGRPDNVGVIGVAAFRERRYPPPVTVTPEPWLGSQSRREDDRANAQRSASADAVAEASSSAGSGYYGGRDQQRAAQPAAAPTLGTGHGERRYDPVTHAAFERESSAPNQVVSLRYDSYEQLARQGIFPQRYPNPSWPREPDPFPVGFVPDP